MAIFKAVTKPDGRAIGKKSPKRLENYLKYETDDKGRLRIDPQTGAPIPRDTIVSAMNGDAEDFSLSLRETFAEWNVNRKAGAVLYRHYVQGFPPEDNGKMTREQCHRMGVELAETVFDGFPVLVVTHFDQENDGVFHWHNHFLVGNCNVRTGRKLDSSKGMLWAVKRFVAAQADGAGLARRGLVLCDGEIQPSESAERRSFAEWQMERRLEKVGAEIAATDLVTQKAELRFVIRAAASQSTSFEEFSEYLLRVYNVQVKKTRGALSFLHPDRADAKTRHGGWIRGRRLGKNFETEESLYVFKESNHRGIGIGADAGAAGLAARYRELYPELFADSSSAKTAGDGDHRAARHGGDAFGERNEGFRGRNGKTF